MTWEHSKLVVIVVIIIKKDESLSVDSRSRDLRKMRHVIYPRMDKANSPSKEYEKFLCLTMRVLCSVWETRMKYGALPLEMVDSLVASAALPDQGLVFRR